MQNIGPLPFLPGQSLTEEKTDLFQRAERYHERYNVETAFSVIKRRFRKIQRHENIGVGSKKLRSK
jgi:hypothetical protein